MKTAAKITAFAMVASLALGLTSCGGNSYGKYLDDNGFIKGVKASEIVTLPKYKGIEIPKSVTTVTQEEINEQVNSILGQEENIEYEQIMDATVKDKDRVNIDYVGTVDGVEFDGGSTNGEGTIVQIGVTTYIDDFLDQLIGHKPGETVNVNVTFPEDYGVDGLNGKDALFVTKINYICGDQKEVALTDEIAKNYGFDTKDELLKDIEDFIYERDLNSFMTQIFEGAVCDNIPQKAIDFAIQKELDYLEDYAAQQGMSIADYVIGQLGYESKDAFVDANKDNFKKSATVYLAYQAVAEKEGLSASEDDVKKYGVTDEEIKENGMPYYKQYVLMVKVVPDFIIKNATVVDDTADIADPDTGTDNTGAGTDNTGAGTDNTGANTDNTGAGTDDIDAGNNNPDAGNNNPDAGNNNPDAGNNNPDAGNNNPDADNNNPDAEIGNSNTVIE